MHDQHVDKEEEAVLLPPDAGGGARRPRREFFGALFLLALAAAFIVQALGMPFKDTSWEWYTAPNIFPLCMAAGLGLSAVFVALRSLLEWRAHVGSIPPLRLVESARAWGMHRFLGGAFLIGVLIFLLGKIDFYVLAPGAVLVFGLLFRSDPWQKAARSAAVAAIFIVVFLFVISTVFGIVFP